MSKQLGYDIPSSIKKTKEALDNVFFKQGLQAWGSQNVFDTDTSDISPGKVPTEKINKPKAEKKNDLLEEIRTRYTTRLELEKRFSTDLRRMKKEEQDELKNF
ncbi:hypothetical protein DR864_28180 [Runella rosea]|uniref:Uncharacterized protein n=2 Tax=Runella rosea TaxID=2259595 RepID=A0A344TRS2_9BACT|nr:hypothetical protein DR864_28180 [Runella rosea]